jgi:hypothetical protein
MLTVLDKNEALTFIPTLSPLCPLLDRASPACALSLELASALLLWTGDRD